MKYDLGILGLGVMGSSLAQNFTRNGWKLIGYDPSPKLPEGFSLEVTSSAEELVRRMDKPRNILLMVPAGKAVDDAIASLLPLLQPEDLLIDGGNSYFADTQRRVDELGAKGIHFIGMGVSGGESGALRGPSMMPGGARTAWPRVEKMLSSIAAKTDDGHACVAWMGSGGAGHYVKMVHNGIEYADMQLIAETYDLLHRGAGLSNEELSAIFHEWNQAELRSYLIEITSKILARKDEHSGKALVDLILDEAAQKGTGKWTSQTALDSGVAIPSINAAVESRLVSAVKPLRLQLARRLGGTGTFAGSRDGIVRQSRSALYASKILAYAQGISLLIEASRENNWQLDIAAILGVWRAGCIIRAALLDDLNRVYTAQPGLPSLLLEDSLSSLVQERLDDWREVVMQGIRLGIPMLASSSALAWYDGMRSAVLPANLTQAQRDFFGAHSYRRVDREGSFHTEWE